MRARLYSLILGAGTLLVPAVAQAEELGNYGAWYAFTQGEDAEKLCYMIAAPIQSLGQIPNRGEVGLIFAGIGLTLSVGTERIIDEGTFSAVVIMVIVTTMITPPALKWSLTRGERRATRARGRESR